MRRAPVPSCRALLFLAAVAAPIAAQADPARKATSLWSFAAIRESTTAQSIDGFLAVAHDRAKLRPASRADRRTLVRRLWFDVCGLPPTPAQIERFMRDRAAGAWERLVDRALRSRAFAENQGRLWLDLARYSDTAGDASDFPIPDAWRYRDWVIEAFAKDMPWREFVRAQLAGDRLVHTAVDAEERSALIVATGFVALSRRFGVKPRQYPHLIREHSIDAVGRAFLGLTLSCARCHDHKFDPISQEDYAALDGIFASTRYPHPGSETKREPSELVKLHPKPIAGSKRLEMMTAYAVIDDKPRNAHVQIGGIPSKKGRRVPRGVLSRVQGPKEVVIDKKVSGRLALADWLTDPGNPLVPRVAVNRLWQQCFGRGLVATPDDFGNKGVRPDHPELLDWLAMRFIEDGSIRKTLRRILTSEAYRRAVDDAQLASVDPENRWFARQKRRRLTAEAHRDALLAVSGELERGSPGPHPFPPLRKWKQYSQHNPFFAEYPSLRRTVYVMRQRLRRTGVLALFDGPDPNAVTGKRGESIVPGQALWLRNSKFARARAAAFARRTRHVDLSTAVQRAFHLAFGRAAAESEVQEAAMFMDLCEDVDEAWESWCHVLLCSNEFVYVD